MKCPYNPFDCPFVDTSGMTTSQNCSGCPHYYNGVKATGGLPICEKIYNYIKSLFK